MIKRFTAYRANISQRTSHNHYQKNPDDQPQFEGVVFSDGSCVIRWRTECRSTAVWASLKDMLLVHGHPEYGTYFEWHDFKEEPFEWIEQVVAAQEKGVV